MWDLSFISRGDLKTHLELTLQAYGRGLEIYDVKRFNANTIDPIKLLFDKSINQRSWEEIINEELARQRDKTRNNIIGYFHQRMFQYIDGCTVPNVGWDIIFQPTERIKLPGTDNVSKAFVELKNKHNTMNSSSSAKTYIKMQGAILSDDDCACFLVEAISKTSQNVPWRITVDGTSQSHRRIRRVSLDEFYGLVTGQPDAFYKLCLKLPEIINEVISESSECVLPDDKVYDEILTSAKDKEIDFLMALFLLGFQSYEGFRDL